MVAINISFEGVAPNSGGGKNFPVSPAEGWLVMIVGEEQKAMSNDQGTRLIFDLVGGPNQPIAGSHADYGLNVVHPNPKTMEIAKQEISAIGWAVGVLKPGQLHLADTNLLWNKPFRVVVVQQAPPNDRYTQVVSVLTADGQKPIDLFNGKASGPTHSAGPSIGGGGGGQPGGFGGAGNGGGQPQGNAGGFGGQPQGQDNGNNGNNGGGSQPQGQNNGWGGAPAGGGGGQPDAGNGGGWGGAPQGGGNNNGGGAGAGAGGGGNGWGGNGGGGPQWGS